MAITLNRLCSAIQQALSARLNEERAELHRLEGKRQQIEAAEAAWQTELRAREDTALEAPARKAAERKAIQDQRDQSRAEFDAACIRRFMALHS